jgi:hypothetical protein
VITEDQSEVITFLSSPSTHGGVPVERIETHSSVVFLAGERALKLKRAVRYDYLDFSNVERRRTLCEAEVRINRRAAPSIYRRALPVTREADGTLALQGAGAPVDWVVDMLRFPQDQLFDRLAARGALPLDLMRPLAGAIARFHASAERSPSHGGKTAMAAVIDGNASGFQSAGAGILDPADCARVTAGARVALDRCGPLLDRRRDEGFVRQCHGDLHLRNIVLLDGQPTLFDAIEFNDDLARIDVLYDLAFLFMDLWHRELPRHANEVMNGSVTEPAEVRGLALLPLFLSTRAAVRAKTGATAASLQSDPDRRAELEGLARKYLQMAGALLRPSQPSIVAVGGLSGSGKSTLARALAPHLLPVPGALVVRSDELRKRLSGVEPLTRLGPEGYAPSISRRVYETLVERAALAVSAGHSVIVDAVFSDDGDRAMVERAAASARVPFLGLWLEAPGQVLVDRVERRTSDASDADAAVIRMQLAHAPAHVNWRRLDAAAGPDAVLSEATAAVREAAAIPPG